MSRIETTSKIRVFFGCRCMLDSSIIFKILELCISGRPTKVNGNKVWKNGREICRDRPWAGLCANLTNHLSLYFSDFVLSVILFGFITTIS